MTLCDVGKKHTIRDKGYNEKSFNFLKLSFWAVRTGLEPATHGVTGRYSNQLNYRTLFSVNICCKFLLAVRTGLEPATHGVTGRYSNQLNYRTNFFDFEPVFFQI